MCHFIDLYHLLQVWKNETVAEQEKRSPSERPVLLSKDINAKIGLLDREVNYLINKMKFTKPKPKPKPKEKNATSSESSKANSSSTSTEDKPGEYIFLSFCLSLALSHSPTHTHTHTHAGYVLEDGVWLNALTLSCVPFC